VLLIGLLTRGARPAAGRGPWDRQNCAHGGICHQLQDSFEAAVQSNPCRHLFDTGWCPAECQRTLAALVTRSAWGMCSARCGWSHAFVDIAMGWVSVCESRARSDAADKIPAVEQPRSEAKREEQQDERVAEGDALVSTRRRVWAGLSERVAAAPLLLVAVVVFISVMDVLRGRGSLVLRTVRTTRRRLRLWRRRRMAVTRQAKEFTLLPTHRKAPSDTRSHVDLRPR